MQAFRYRLTNYRQRTLRVFRQQGPWAFTRKFAEKIYRKLAASATPVDPEYRYQIEVLLKDPFANLSSLDVAAQIRLDPVVSIVVPVYNGIDYVPDCVRSFFRAATSFRVEIILIDNGSKDGTLEALRGLARLHGNVVVVANEVNRGFAGAINQGAQLARGEFVAICNSDILVTPGWLDRLVQAMRTDPRLAVVSPVTNYVGEGPQLDPAAAAVTPETAAAYAQRVAGRAGVIPVIDRLVFFCVLLRKQYFDFLGGVSGVFGLGNYEDDDFCLRARLAGYTLAVVPGSFVFHYGTRTFTEQKIDHVGWMLKNEKIYFDRVARFASSIPVRPHKPAGGPPRVSVIVRTKDRPYPLRRALNSLANQTYAHFEVVVVNDGGVDAGPLVAEFEPYLAFDVVAHSRPTGRAQALNAGLAAARGEWITYLDDDDVVYPTHLELLVDALTRQGAPVAYTDANKVLCWSDSPQKNLVVVDRTRFAFDKPFSRGELLVDNWIPIMSFMHPKRLVDEVGAFDESFGIYEDWDFLLRLSARHAFCHIPRPSCEYRFRFGPHFDDSTLHLRENALQSRAVVYARNPVTDEEIERKRAMTIVATRQQIADVRQIASLALDDLQRSFLIAARLGGFALPAPFRKERGR